MRIVVRRIGALVLVAAAVAVWVALAPEPVQTDHDDEVQTILADATANNAGAEGAPQQTVVNGWTTRDLLALLSRQLDEQPEPDQRPGALLMILVAGVALHLLTTPTDSSAANRSGV